MWYLILILFLLWAGHKWVYWRLTTMALLLYYAECGQEHPDIDTIQKYRIKVAVKSLGIKESENEI